MSENRFRPICSGQCSRAKSYGQLYMTLSTQDAQYLKVDRLIEQHRVSWLTPDRMKAELADLSGRIASALARR